jgi:hypothetical protein
MAFPLRAEEIWERLVEAPLAGRRVPTLGAEDLALFLAAHGTKEGWRNLKWVADFGEFARLHQDLDWGRVLERARRAGCGRTVLVAALLASELVEAPVAVELVEEARRSPVIQKLAGDARSRMVEASRRGELREFLDGTEVHDRWVDRVRPVVRLLTTRTVGDYEGMRLPRGLWQVYRLTRVVRLAVKGVKKWYG